MEKYIYRAKLEKIPVILASATPSLETLKNAKDVKFETLRLNRRATGASLPNINAIDLRGKELNEGMSNHLLEATESELEKGIQVVICLNRRGYASALICKTCGWISNCDRCDALMTVHKKPLKLQCHHCEAQKEFPIHVQNVVLKIFYNMVMELRGLKNICKYVFQRLKLYE